MSIKWVGAILVVAGCGSVGFLMAHNVRRESAALKQLLGALSYMAAELECRMTPLPELCRKVCAQNDGCIGAFFRILAQELDGQIAPDAASCALAALAKCRRMPEKAGQALTELGKTLGELDLSGQLKGLEALRETCTRMYRELEENRTQRLRSYETLGLCAGAALAILLL